MDDGVRPFAEPFMRLVRTVVPFYLLFQELSLQMRLRVLIQTICDDVDKFLSQQPLIRRSSTTPSIATTRTTPLSPPIQSPVSQQQPTPTVLASPIDGPVTQLGVLHTPLTQLPTPLASLTVKLPGRPDIRLEDFSPRTTPPTIPQVGAPVVSPPPMTASPTIDTMALQSTRPKTKKRKFDFSDVLEEDVKWFKHTHPAGTQEPPVSSLSSPVQAILTTATPVTKGPEVQVMEATSMKPLGSAILAPESKEAGATETGPSSVTQDAKLDPKVVVASRSPSTPLRESVAPKSRSHSGPPKDAVKPTLKRKAPDDEADVGTAQVSSASQSPPQSPTILTASITRRRTSPPPPVAAAEPDTAETQPKPSEPATAAPPPPREVLPSPLSSKKKKKKRKGPPGLRFLPEVAVKEELAERPGVGIPAEDEPNAPVTSKGEEELSEPEAKSRSKTPPPDLTPSPKPSIPPPESPPHGTEPTPAVLPQLDSGAVTEGEEVQALDRPLDAVLDDTVVIATASPDAMEVDAALQPEPNGITPEHTAPEVSEQDEVAQPEEIPAEEASLTQDRSFDDVEMRDSPPVPEVASAETVPASPGANDVGAAVPQLEVLDSNKVNGIEYVDQHEDKDGTKREAVPASSPVLDLPATAPIAEPQAEDMEDMDLQSSPFESNVIRLLSLERGHPSYTSSQEPVELHFTLTEEEAAQVARWNNRGKINSAYSNLSTSMCVSLVSYPLEQCAQAFECDPDAEQGELDVVGFGRPRPWPEDGSVYVVLDVSGDHGPPRSINVAPPFGFDTIHKPVDLGDCGVHPGENTLHLFQFRDHSDRIFAVVLHHPTAAQLTALQAALDRERALEDWIEDLGRFNLTQLKLVAIPVGNVVSDS